MWYLAEAPALSAVACNSVPALTLLSGSTRKKKPFEPLRRREKQYHMKVLLNSFHLNGHTLGFYPKTLKLDPQQNKQYRMKVLFNSFHLNGHTLGFYPQAYMKKLDPQHNKQHHLKITLNTLHSNGHTDLKVDFNRSDDIFTRRYSLYGSYFSDCELQ